ncbi:MAG: ATP-binding protein [Coriobacteriia bacterium]|nr:ATP-binding protein [Coriobacteriia bacterium]
MNQLTSFLDEVATESHLRVETDLGDGFVRLRTDEAERRQAAHDIRTNEDMIIELLRNSRDAHARNIFLAFAKSGDDRVVVVVDDGDGIPAHMHERVFEPRVTSKLDSMHLDKWGIHGRGMALYAVKVNARESRICCSAPGKGCSLYARTNPDKVVEKADQSTFPTFILKDGGKVTVKGPKNILRTACEFALEHRSSVSLYVGSISQIAATLYEFGCATISSVERAFGDGRQDSAVVKRLAFARDCQEFAQIAHELGLDMSERSARRIMDGEVRPAPEIKELITFVDQREQAAAPAKTPRKRTSGGIRFAPEDLSRFKDTVARAYAELADAYYLESDPHIVVQKRSDALHISIPLYPNS